MPAVVRNLGMTQSLDNACDAIRRGGAAIFPTDTFYALGVNALDAVAVRTVFELKGRDEGQPLPVLIPSTDSLALLCDAVPEAAIRLATVFWPGALTIVVKKSPVVPDVVSAGAATVGVRVPDHPVARELLRRVGTPVTGTSANPSGTPPTKDLQQIHDWFEGTGAVIVDAACGPQNEPSTVIDLTLDAPTIVRQGSVPFDALQELLPDVTIRRLR